MSLQLAGRVFDIYDDLTLDTVKDAPDFIKEASVEDRENLKKYPDDAFALIVLARDGKEYRKYPVMSKEASLLSAHYFENSIDNLPENEAVAVGQKILNSLVKFAAEEHLEHFPVLKTISGYLSPSPDTVRVQEEKVQRTVGESMRKLAAELDSQQVNALPDSAFALVANDKDGKKVRKYPVHDASHAQAAVSRFAQNWDKLPPKWRTVTAKKIMEAVKKHSILVSKDNPLHKYASWETYSLMLEHRIKERASLYPEAKKDYMGLLEKKAELDPVDFAEELYAIDRKHKLTLYYDKVLEDAFATTFDKTASGEQLSPQDTEIMELLNSTPNAFDKLSEVLNEATLSGLRANPIAALKLLLPEEKESIIGALTEG